jgi:hypothetical protein
MELCNRAAVAFYVRRLVSFSVVTFRLNYLACLTNSEESVACFRQSVRCLFNVGYCRSPVLRSALRIVCNEDSLCFQSHHLYDIKSFVCFLTLRCNLCMFLAIIRWQMKTVCGLLVRTKVSVVTSIIIKK